MKIMCSVAILMIVCLSAGLLAQEKEGIRVEKIAICTSVENRQPVGTDTAFAANVGKLYCFTKLTSPTDTSTISHVWFYQDKEMTKVELSMKAKSWRTWSAKTILPEWKGDWRVEVRDSEGNVVSTILFKII